MRGQCLGAVHALAHLKVLFEGNNVLSQGRVLVEGHGPRHGVEGRELIVARVVELIRDLDVRLVVLGIKDVHVEHLRVASHGDRRSRVIDPGDLNDAEVEEFGLRAVEVELDATVRREGDRRARLEKHLADHADLKRVEGVQKHKHVSRAREHRRVGARELTCDQEEKKLR